MQKYMLWTALLLGLLGLALSVSALLSGDNPLQQVRGLLIATALVIQSISSLVRPQRTLLANILLGVGLLFTGIALILLFQYK